METDLSIRLHEYATAMVAADATARDGANLYADAKAASRAAATSASVSLICSHTRELRGNPVAGLLPGQDELDFLIAGKPVANADDRSNAEPDSPGTSPHVVLPLAPGQDSLANLVRGADGIPSIKNQNA